MAIDLNNDWADADVAALLTSVEGYLDWRREVNQDSASGVSFLHEMHVPTRPEYDHDLHWFLELWRLGTDFVGPGAVSDKGWQ